MVLVEVRAQHRHAAPVKSAAVATGGREIEQAGLIRAPAVHVVFEHRRKPAPMQAIGCLLDSRALAVAEGKTKREPAVRRQVQLRRERDIAGSCGPEGPFHAPVAVQILPAVGLAHVADGHAREGRRGGHRGVAVTAPSDQPVAFGVMRDATVVLRSLVTEMGRPQQVQAILPGGVHQRLEVDALKHGVGLGIGAHGLDEPVAAGGIAAHDPEGRDVFLEPFDLVYQIAPFLVKQLAAVGDEKLEVALMGTVHRRIVNLRENSFGNREPHTRAFAERRADRLLVRAGPGGGQARCAEGVFRHAQSTPLLSGDGPATGVPSSRC